MNADISPRGWDSPESKRRRALGTVSVCVVCMSVELGMIEGRCSKWRKRSKGQEAGAGAGGR
jgi:hypothetical protein